MRLKEKKEIRKYRRFNGYDYARGAALFITIVTNPRRRLFGGIVDARLRRTALGLAVESRLTEVEQTPGIRLFNFVVMPDHVHLQLHLRAGLQEPLVALGRAIGAFKSLCAKDFHELTGERGPLWQQGYHDWICVSEEMIAAVNRYIDYNPLKFELRYNQPEFLAIREPIAAWRLSPEEFWRGIGAVDLLDGDTPFIALRISRRLSLFAADRRGGLAHSPPRRRLCLRWRVDKPWREGGARHAAGRAEGEDRADPALGDAARLQGWQHVARGGARPTRGDHRARQQRGRVLPRGVPGGQRGGGGIGSASGGIGSASAAIRTGAGVGVALR